MKYGNINIPLVNSTAELVPTTSHDMRVSAINKKAIALCYIKNKPCLLIGETGTGKTSIIRELAYKLRQEYVRVNMTGYTSPDELIGSKGIQNGATLWEDGIIVNAMKRGAILVLEEINATSPDCLFILHSLLDDDKRISLPTGEVITPHENFRVFATANPDYAGTKSMNQALLDRFGAILEVTELSEGAEATLLEVRTGLDHERATRLVSLAKHIRKQYKDNKMSIYCSFRALLHIAENIIDGINPQEAVQVVLFGKTQENESRQAILDVYKSVFATSIEELEKSVVIDITRGEYQELTSKAEKLRELQQVIENMRKLTTLDSKSQEQSTSEAV